MIFSRLLWTTQGKKMRRATQLRIGNDLLSSLHQFKTVVLFLLNTLSLMSLIIDGMQIIRDLKLYDFRWFVWILFLSVREECVIVRSIKPNERDYRSGSRTLLLIFLNSPFCSILNGYIYTSMMFRILDYSHRYCCHSSLALRRTTAIPLVYTALPIKT
jgi:hypothetical protein